jgi:hypothetical protein
LSSRKALYIKTVFYLALHRKGEEIWRKRARGERREQEETGGKKEGEKKKDLTLRPASPLSGLQLRVGCGGRSQHQREITIKMEPMTRYK